MSAMEKIKQYYIDKKIAPNDWDHFKCVHRTECRGDCTNFACSRFPLIGQYYESCDGTFPRLLFVSIDPGKLDVSHKEIQEPDGIHWCETKKLAELLLKSFCPQVNYQNSESFFAHINTAKCSTNSPNRAQAPNRLFHNCKEFLPGEIKILMPDILVTQGNKPKGAITWQIQKRESALHFQAMKIPANAENSILTIDGRSILWLHMCHPGFWRRGAKGKIAKERYESVLSDWVEIVHKWKKH